MSNIDATVAQNWSKIVPSSKFGTPELAVLVVQDANDNINFGSDYELSHSNFQKAVNQIQAWCEVFAVFEPTSNYFTMLVKASSVPFAEGQDLGNGNTIPVLSDELSDFFGEQVNVWNAEIRSDNINYD
jgi:hypothetical protein